MRVLLVLLSMMLLPLPLSAAGRINIVTSFTVLADLTRQVGGEHVQVVNLAGADLDPATYQASADDARHIGAARLVIENGLGLEPWLDPWPNRWKPSPFGLPEPPKERPDP